MWCLGTWFSSGLGTVRFTVALDDLKGFFNLNDSMFIYMYIYMIYTQLSLIEGLCFKHRELAI